MKAHPSLKKSFLVVFERPLTIAILTIFGLTVATILFMGIYHPSNYQLITKIASWSFGAIVLLGFIHLMITRVFVTRFSAKKNRIQLIYYGGRPEIYREPVFKKLPYAEIIFPEDWNLTHSAGRFFTPLFLGVKTSSNVAFHLYFRIWLQISGGFKAEELENLISGQKARCPWQTKFEFIDCLEDFLVQAYSKNHASLKLLLEEHHLQQLSFHDLETSILEITKIPNLLSNVEKMELRLTDVNRVVRLNPPSLSSFKKAAAVL